jgi:hypothetical protein
MQIIGEKNYKEVFVVTNATYPSAVGLVTVVNGNLGYSNVQSFQNKEFETYELAVEYITDMLKYHDAQFQIQKVFRK